MRCLTYLIWCHILLFATIYQLLEKKSIDTKPTEGYNVESLKIGDFVLNVWDIGGQDSYRNFWRHYYTGTQGLVFVIDSCDTDRLKLCREEIVDVLSDDQLVNAAVLILANKQDQPGAMSPEQILQTLKLDAFLNGRTFKIQGSTATTGDGLLNGFTWLASNTRAL